MADSETEAATMEKQDPDSNETTPQPSTPDQKPSQETTLTEKGAEVKSKIYVQLISAVVVNLTLISAGLTFSWTAVSLDKLESPGSDILLTSDEGGWVATISFIGACFGPATSLLLIDRIGRKWFLYSTAAPTLACWILIYFAKSWEWLLVARFLGGLPLGAYYAMVPVYLGELVETRIRGAAGAMMVLSMNVGYVIMYSAGPLVDRKTLSIICAIPTVLYLVLAPWIPDSPYYYLKKGKTKCAAVTLVWLRRRADNAAEMAEMQKQIDEEKTGGVAELYRNPTSRKGFLLLLLLLAGQQFSGLAAVLSYYGIIIADMQLPLQTSHALLIISGINVASSIFSTFLVDRMGRRPVYLISSLGCAICLAAMGGFYLAKNLGINLSGYEVVPLVIVLIYTIIISFGIAQTPAIVQSEIFPINVKAWASTIANTYGSILGMVVTKVFQLVADAWGYHVIYLVFAALELIIAVIVAVIMPETKLKSFKEIQELLRGKAKAEK